MITSASTVLSGRAEYTVHCIMCPATVETIKYVTDINLEVKEVTRRASSSSSSSCSSSSYPHSDQCILCKLLTHDQNIVPLDDYSTTVYDKARSLCSERKNVGSYENGQIYFLVHKIFGKTIITTSSPSGHIDHYPVHMRNLEVALDQKTQLDNFVDLIYHFRTQVILEELTVLLKNEIVPKTSFKISDIENVIKELQMTKLLEKDGFDIEFQQLSLIDRRHSFTNDVGKINPLKNRYRNIIPYDHSRVKLVKRKPDSDYINANYIFAGCDINYDDDNMMERVPKLYIATQACIENTREDFWSMIWQEKCHIIVTILNKDDASHERYWPQNGTTEMYGRFTVTNSSQTKHQNYYKRRFSVSNCSQMLAQTSLNVIQYHIHVWNDNTVPESCDFLFKLLADIDKELYNFREMSNNLVEKVCIHCSAGVGRTGTFIAIDMAKDIIKYNDDNSTIDIFKLISIIRAQRPGLVRNVKQYKFIYFSLSEYYKSKSRKY